MPHLSAEYIDRNIAVLSGKVDTLERRESELRDLLNAIALEKRALVAERAQLEAERTPFHWLPPELLIHIFLLATTTTTTTYHDALDLTESRLDIAPVDISHVCQRWRNIALSTPVLWRRIVLTPSDVSFGRSLSLATQTFLERSKGVPVEVFYALALSIGKNEIHSSSSNNKAPPFVPPPPPRNRDTLREWREQQERRQQQQEQHHRHYHHRFDTPPQRLCGESYVLHTFPPLRSLYIHGNYHIIADTLAYVHAHATDLTSLESLELALMLECTTSMTTTVTTPGILYECLRVSSRSSSGGGGDNDLKRIHHDDVGSFRRTTHRFPILQTLKLRDVPLPCLTLGRLPNLREITLEFETLPVGHFDLLRIPYLARLLACAPRVEKLALLRAGPVFSTPLDTSLKQALSLWEDGDDDNAAWQVDDGGGGSSSSSAGGGSLPPVLLEHLREVEWTDVHPETLHLFLMHFPAPRLEVLDIAFAGPRKCEKLAAWLHPTTFAHIWDVATTNTHTQQQQQQQQQLQLQLEPQTLPLPLPVLELSNLKILRADCSSGEALRVPFLRLFFPVLETLSLSNRSLSAHFFHHSRTVLPTEKHHFSFSAGAKLPRPESIFRDPRMPRLSNAGYMPALQRLDCNFIPNIAPVLEELAASSRSAAGVRACPLLRHIQLWCCDGVDPAVLERLVKLRNGSGSGSGPGPGPGPEPGPGSRSRSGLGSLISLSDSAAAGSGIGVEEDASSRDGVGKKRPMKRLPKGANTPVSAAPSLSPSSPSVSMGMGIKNDEWQPEKVWNVAVEGCRPITREEAMSLRQWGVDIQWIGPQS
ncbi:hypothetical protein B0F90DRAFT_1928563 [Multifurca ochricompacta]|uniref:F-box domain-containing protein n=1 Tax=Multifurca ochricompacta TaxID=376703 RepID=A0AAD4LY14_9AGAM|nr:hypothetical protein B0F90DRAFT_1928563 [Multifurca ochricompacta]